MLKALTGIIFAMIVFLVTEKTIDNKIKTPKK